MFRAIIARLAAAPSGRFNSDAIGIGRAPGMVWRGRAGL
jgi:hypothetical protein